MTLIVGTDVGKDYAHRPVFAHAAFRIEPGDRIGLVGVNGGGKTTLLRLLTGDETPTAGQVQPRRDLTVGYLPQDAGGEASQQTVWDAMLEAFADLRRLEQELGQLAARLAEGGQEGGDEALMARYSALQEAFERRDGYVYEARMHTVLAGLGFTGDDLRKPLAQLSGGQHTRALLARLLLEDPGLLLLDEPTNYLDLRAVEWLEGWLLERGGSYLVVSHDRWFLDRVTERTWELAFGRLETYRGNYSAYVRQRQERYERRRKEWEAQQAYVARTEAYIRRYLAGQRTKEAQGRRRRLERFLRNEAVERPREHKRLRLRLEASGRTGDIVLRTRDLKLSYTDAAAPVLRSDGEHEIHRGWRTAVVGPNGAGKTTLVRAILGELAPQEGEVRLGAQVEIGYLPQTQEYLDGALTVLQSLAEVAPADATTGDLRDLLGSFLFSGDDVDKRIEQLSGGERSRVALARLVLQGANFLVLDEPTNHLDILSQEVLEEVIADFGGTVLLVSHDRYLIQSLATHVWLVEEGRLQAFDGNWSQYCEWRERRASTAAPDVDADDDVAAGVDAEAAARTDDREARRDARRRRKAREQLAAQHADLETQIATLEADKAALAETIGAAGEAQDVDRVTALAEELQQVEARLEAAMAEWEALGSRLEAEPVEAPT